LEKLTRRDHRGLSAFYGTPLPDEDRFKVLDRAYELGQTFWDCGLLMAAYGVAKTLSLYVVSLSFRYLRVSVLR
jgi:hypothetical protein